MAYEQPVALHGTFTASADLSGAQFLAVKVSGSNTVTKAAASTDAVIGILQNKPASGQEAVVMTLGITKAVAGAAVAAGAEVMANASAKVITAASAAGANRVIGIALEAAANADEIISVLLIGPIRMF